MSTKTQRRAKKELTRFRTRMRKTYVRKMGSHAPDWPEVKFFRKRGFAFLEETLYTPLRRPTVEYAMFLDGDRGGFFAAQYLSYWGQITAPPVLTSVLISGA